MQYLRNKWSDAVDTLYTVRFREVSRLSSFKNF